MTEADALADTNSLYVNSASDIEITNEAQSASKFAGVGFYVYQRYYFRIESNEPVKSFYIDWDDGEDASLTKANYTLLHYENPVFSAITTHVFTQNKQHYPKIRAKSREGFWSKLYTPNGADITGWEVMAQGESLSAGQNEFSTASYDASGANARIPIFTPAEKAPSAILRADKTRVPAGINQLPLAGSDNDFDGEQITVYCSNANRTNVYIDITYHNLSSDAILTESKKHGQGVSNVSKILKVKLNDLREASDSYNGSTENDKLYPGERMYLRSGSDSEYLTVAEVSLGNPILEADNDKYVVHLDASASYARSSNVSITKYWFDTGNYSNFFLDGDIQSSDSAFTHISDTMADGTNNIMYTQKSTRQETYNFDPYRHFIDDNYRYLPQGRLARLQVGTDKSTSLDSDGDTISRSYLEHWQQAYYSKDASPAATSGKNRPVDQQSSSLIAYKNVASPVGIWKDLADRNNSTKKTDYVLRGHDNGTSDPTTYADKQSSIFRYEILGSDVTSTSTTNYLIMARDEPWDSLHFELDWDLATPYVRPLPGDTGSTGKEAAQFKCDVYYSAGLLGSGAHSGEGTKVWKPLKFVDKTKWEEVNEGVSSDANKKHTSFYKSGAWEWDIPSDWEAVDPSNIGDAYYPGGYDGREYEESRLYMFNLYAGLTAVTISSISSGSGTNDRINTGSAHSLAVNDLIYITGTQDMPKHSTSTSFDRESVYYVKTVVDTDTIEISENRGSATLANMSLPGAGTTSLYKIDGDLMDNALSSKYLTLGNPVSHYVWIDPNSTGTDPAVGYGTSLEADVALTGGQREVAVYKRTNLDTLPKFVVQNDYFTIDDVRTTAFGTATDYYIWFNVDSAGSDPSPGGGRTGVECSITSCNPGGGGEIYVTTAHIVNQVKTAINSISGLTASEIFFSPYNVTQTIDGVSKTIPTGFHTDMDGSNLTAEFLTQAAHNMATGVSTAVTSTAPPYYSPAAGGLLTVSGGSDVNLGATSFSLGTGVVAGATHCEGVWINKGSGTSDYPGQGDTITSGDTAQSTDWNVISALYVTGRNLDGAIGADDTTFFVNDAAQYLSSGQTIYVDDEFMRITGKADHGSTVSVQADTTVSGYGNSTLNEGGTLTDDDETITLTDASGFPSSGLIKIGSEQITYSGKSSNDLTGCGRGANSTSATTHSDGSTVKGGFDTSATTIKLASTSSLNATGTIMIYQELITYTGKTSDSITGCTRGVSPGTAAQRWFHGQTVYSGHGAAETTIQMASASGFPTSGTVKIQSSSPGTVERVSYTGISGSNLTGCTRGADSTTAGFHKHGDNVTIDTLTVTRGYGGTAKASHSDNAKASILSNVNPIIKYALFRMGDELIKVNNVSSSSNQAMTWVSRGFGGTEATEHDSGTLMKPVYFLDGSSAPLTNSNSSGGLSNALAFSYDVEGPVVNDLGSTNTEYGGAGGEYGAEYYTVRKGVAPYMTKDAVLSGIRTAVAADADFETSAVTSYSSTLAEDVDASETEIDVAAGDIFGVSDVVISGNEQMKITSINGNTLTVSRAYNSTSAAAKSSGEKISTNYINFKSKTKGATTDIGYSNNLTSDFTFDTKTQGSDITQSSFIWDGVYNDYFGHTGSAAGSKKWTSDYKKYGLFVRLYSDCDSGGHDNFDEMRIRHIWPFTNSHSQYIEVYDPMHVSLNAYPIAQSVSLKRVSKQMVTESREGITSVTKIGQSNGSVQLGSVDLGDETVREKFFKFHRDFTPVYYDVEHNNGGTTRLYGVIVNMAEDLPTAAMIPKFTVSLLVTHVLNFNTTTGAMISKGFAALGGQDSHVADYN